MSHDAAEQLQRPPPEVGREGQPEIFQRDVGLRVRGARGGTSSRVGRTGHLLGWLAGAGGPTPPTAGAPGEEFSAQAPGIDKVCVDVHFAWWSWQSTTNPYSSRDFSAKLATNGLTPLVCLLFSACRHNPLPCNRLSQYARATFRELVRGASRTGTGSHWTHAKSSSANSKSTTRRMSGSAVGTPKRNRANRSDRHRGRPPTPATCVSVAVWPAPSDAYARKWCPRSNRWRNGRREVGLRNCRVVNDRV